jgi:hypothetical protein
MLRNLAFANLGSYQTNRIYAKSFEILLKDVQNANVDEATLLGVIDLSALDDDSVSRKVDTPSQGGSAHEHLEQTDKVIFTQSTSYEATLSKPAINC